MEINKKKILLVQLFSNGDCLYATVIARQIKTDFPNCELTWAIASFCKNIIDLNPYVDHVRIVDNVPKNDVVAFREFKKKLKFEKESGLWDEIFITTNMDNNQALYDGTIRGMVLRAYPKKITVPLQPILVLSDLEKQNASDFFIKNNIASFKNVILWEYAPQSGQSDLNFELVKKIADSIVKIPSTCVILTSANSFQSTENIIDASTLTVRENAALSHYCNLFIGCSSGITWLCTSSGGKMLPMIQLLNPNAAFINAPSVDFARYNTGTDSLIEIIEIDEAKILQCVRMIFESGFLFAKEKFNESLPLQFNTTRLVVYNMLCYLQFRSILRHLKIMTSIYGVNWKLFLQFILAFLLFPYKLISNQVRKRLKGARRHSQLAIK